MPSKVISYQTTVRTQTLQAVKVKHQSLRSKSGHSLLASIPTNGGQIISGASHVDRGSPLSRHSTGNLLRRLFLGSIFASPLLLKPGLAIMHIIANSKSAALDPDRNRLLGSILKPLVYKQFCAGTNKREVQKTISNIKQLGFSGLILTYGRELQVSADKSLVGYSEVGGLETGKDIEKWRDGNLQTLEMVGEEGDLAIKITGAGHEVTECLMRGDAPPSQFTEAMDAICKKAIAQNSRIWIDSEQSAVQPTIDVWTIDLMRRYNKGPKALIYNTIQAYLKNSRVKLERQLRCAHEEGWTYALKLVRGAYMSNDVRSQIHDTKADTDDSYNGIVRDLLSGTVPGFSPDNFPKMQLFLAGHNTNSVRKAIQLAKDLAADGKLKVTPEFCQLQGMADDIGLEIIQEAEQLDSKLNDGKYQNDTSQIFVPNVYKCSTWGSVRECMQYLLRRAVENQGATGRMKDGVAGVASELWRRFAASFSR